MDQATTMAERLRDAVGDERVLAALAAVPRELFVPERERGRAYENIALPIACNQTISQPLVVGRMLALLALRGTEHVLDIGTGSGYHAALLAVLSAHVWTVERHPELTQRARRVISTLGIGNVTFVVGDGYEGLPEHAPFDAINVAAAIGDAVPSALEGQLAVGGRLVAPVGGAHQHLILTRRTEQGLDRQQLDAVRFVPLVRGA